MVKEARRKLRHPAFDGKCLNCDRKFGDRNDLLNHSNSCHWNLKHKCMECGNFFKTESLLIVHKESRGDGAGAGAGAGKEG